MGKSSRSISGRRHAQAVFRIAVETNQLDKWLADLELLAGVLGDPAVRAFLENPKVNVGNKEDLLGSVLEGVSPLALNLADLLVAKKRLHLLPDLVAEYRRLMNAQRGIEEAEVTTAVGVDRQQAERIGRGLATMAGKGVLLDMKVDADILGGFVARLGDKLIDGSVRTRLEELRRNLC